TILERDVLRSYLPPRRWYGAKDMKLDSVSLTTSVQLHGPGHEWLLTVVEAKPAGGHPPQRYSLPLAVGWSEIHTLPQQMQTVVVAKVRKGPREGVLYDAAAEERLTLTLVDKIRQATTIDLSGAKLVFRPTAAFGKQEVPATPVVRMLGLEQSNTSVLIEDYLVLKLYRRLA